jgi:hypothetical protein
LDRPAQGSVVDVGQDRKLVEARKIAKALDGSGAWWAVVGAKYRFTLFGPYPYEEE